MNNTLHHIHFLGIGGIGVSALAQVAQARGIRVSGSDPNAIPEANPAVRRLQEGGATLYREHRFENLADDVDLVVASAAIGAENPEIRAALERKVRVVSRAEFLGELMAAHKGPKIAVAGTHGKTTTTGMIGVLLQHAGLDPTVFVGGEVHQLGGNVRIGSDTGPFVAEACEAYDSFLSLKPDFAVLTNVEADHLDHYGTEERMRESFRRFLSAVPEANGAIIAGVDDPGVRIVLEQMPSPPRILEYGLQDHFYSGGRAKRIVLEGMPTFEWHAGSPYQPVVLRVPGQHNIQNALAAATVGRLLGVPDSVIAEGLNAFSGAQRRQEILGEIALGAGTVVVMDDYAHHPTEIRATLAALRSAYPQRRLIAVFQPHLYSRTRDFLSEFAVALSTADRLIVTDIYAARERPMEGVSSADIVRLAVQERPELSAQYVPNKQEIPAMLLESVAANDLVVLLGAGDIREQGERFVAQMVSGRVTR